MTAMQESEYTEWRRIKSIICPLRHRRIVFWTHRWLPSFLYPKRVPDMRQMRRVHPYSFIFCTLPQCITFAFLQATHQIGLWIINKMSNQNANEFGPWAPWASAPKGFHEPILFRPERFRQTAHALEAMSDHNTVGS